jgi:hypothetical protein
VTLALREFIQRRRSADITALFDSIDYDEAYHYKALRNSREGTR